MLVSWRDNVLHPWCVLAQTSPHLETNPQIFHRLKYSRNRQRFPYLWRSLHRVYQTLPAETPPDRWMGRWMVEHSWSSRGCIFYRIRISKHDLGSCLDREGRFAVFIRPLRTQVAQIPASQDGNLTITTGKVVGLFAGLMLFHGLLVSVT